MPRLVIAFLVLPVFGGSPIIDIRPDTPPTIQETIDALPAAAGHTILRLAPGTYREKISIPKNKPSLKLLGTSATTTRIVWSDTAKTPDSRNHPIGTFRSSTVIVESDDFAAENITFENDHGPGIQAVAFSIGGDRGVFRHCRFLGWQDTLLLRKKRHYFDQCHIAGSVDFIFGDATAYFNACTIEVRDKGYLTAASTPKESQFGFIFSRCTITTAEGKAFFLGRPWQPHASVHFLECQLPAEVRPEGWDHWRNPDNEATVRYGEWRSSGPGAARKHRVPWSRQLPDSEGHRLSSPSEVLSPWNPNAESSSKPGTKP